jgi:hypothetical protein
MASAAQINANRTNAKLSTGPRTPEGKAAVAQNRLSHGLAGRHFVLLPGEDPAEFEALAAAFVEEHRPSGPSEEFLVAELAQAQWKLGRAAGIEAGLLAGETEDRSLTAIFQADMAAGEALLKLARYENGIRRNWYRALNELRALRRERTKANVSDIRLKKIEERISFNKMIEESMRIPNYTRPTVKPAAPAAPPRESKPIAQPPAPDTSKPTAPTQPARVQMPAHLRKELDDFLNFRNLNMETARVEVSDELTAWLKAHRRAR